MFSVLRMSVVMALCLYSFCVCAMDERSKELYVLGTKQGEYRVVVIKYLDTKQLCVRTLSNTSFRAEKREAELKEVTTFERKDGIQQYGIPTSKIGGSIAYTLFNAEGKMFKRDGSLEKEVRRRPRSYSSARLYLGRRLSFASASADG